MANNVTSSATAALSTSGSGNINLLVVPLSAPVDFIVAINTGTVDAQYSTDAGTTWFALPAGSTFSVQIERVYNGTILARRVGGTDATGLWAYGYFQRP